MTENTTRPVVLEYVEPQMRAIGGGSQAKERIGLTTAKNKKINLARMSRRDLDHGQYVLILIN
jgi:hypothetical protein